MLFDTHYKFQSEKKNTHKHKKQKIFNDAKKFIEPAIQANPNVTIVHYSYDVCEKYPISCANIVNSLTWITDPPGMVRNLHEEVLKPLEKYFTQSYSNTSYVAVNVLGACQTKANMKGASVGNPIKQWSPKEYFENDGFHLNQKGYQTVYNAMWDVYFQNQTHRFQTTISTSNANQFNTNVNNITSLMVYVAFIVSFFQ